ncbi:hypothetical protein J3L18_10785 [Mucilaginibacter gossypii]|uniref:hypothetical protein n=1 Tax=Mucilaginibacter gossypii TaxID=551996 RepID=UPI000DCF4472|nr:MULTISPECIES: hypothetical protein [Mucilaginibacter]QTE39512.1 hypothetical protein J3L18_10785 [Mucilaginibacter gossypii]RAV56127.1 hypothetical protein DIU36_15340 [Mucilaginibacter rubeus]
MNSQQKAEQDIEKAVELFRNFITKDYTLERLAQKLDEIGIQYGQLLIDNADQNGYSNRSDGFYLLYELRCICQLKDLDNAA